MKTLPSGILDRLSSRAESADQSSDWPSESLAAVQSAGALGWSIPVEYDGTEIDRNDLFDGHERIAAACLTTAFILSQRESAIRQLAKGPTHLRERYLPGLAAGATFATVGLSQLTTSRQHGGPALRAAPRADGGYLLEGEIPWVTGADQAEVIVIGAALDDGAQILIALPTDRPGVCIEAPMPLAALTGSRTSAVRLDKVAVEGELILGGPAERVLGPVGGGGLETSNLAIGLAEAATSYLECETATRPYLDPVAAHFRTAVDETRARLRALVISAPDQDEVMSVRTDSTSIALRATQTCLLTAKGAGFVVPHPAQRWSRQALFFLVWSCPRPVAAGVLSGLMTSH